MKNARARKLTYAALGAAFLVLSAWLSLPLGAVPVSLQTLGVMLLGGLLGPLLGTVSVLLYLFLGAMGLPVFAAFGAGAGALVGPSGGFLLSLPLLSLLVGFCAKGGKRALALSLATATLLHYAAGSLFYFLVYAHGTSFAATLAVTVLPFLLPDALKCLLAFVLVRHMKRWHAKPF